MPIAFLEDLARRADWLVGCTRHPQRTTDVVDDVLIRRRDGAARRFLADALRALPVGIDVAARELGARLVVRGQLGLSVALSVAPDDCCFAGRRPLQLFF